MKVLGILITLFSIYGYCDWHSWADPPQENQLYMWVEVKPGETIENRQVYHICRFDSLKPQLQSIENGWWDVTQQTVWQWLQEGNKVIYFP